MRAPRGGAVLLLLIPVGGAAPAAEGPLPPLSEALEAAVDLPSPLARAEAARRILKRPDATVPNLLAAMRAFGRFAPQRPGTGTEAVPLFDGKGTATEEVTVYTPPSYDPARPAPLLLVLHDSGLRGRDEPAGWKAAADALGMVVVAPTDRLADKGWTATPAERHKALAALRWARRRWNADENRIFGAGSSRGGHLLWDIALRHPDLFAAVAPMVGGPRLANSVGENNFRYIENLRRLPIRDLQGEEDDPRLLDSLRRAFSFLEEFRNPDARLVLFPGLGHACDTSKVDWVEWLGKVRRDPVSEEVVRRAVDPGEARAFWAEATALGKGAQERFTLPVDPRKWNALSDAERREAFIEAADGFTARLRVRRAGPGAYEAEGREVERFRILLPEGGFEPEKPVSVTFRGRTVKAVPRPDARVLLEDVVERFDRTFLPVAEVRVP